MPNKLKERFLREAQAATALDHPHICTVHEVEESEGTTYIAMAYVEGRSLREKVFQRPLTVEQALDIAIQVAAGLEEAHKKGIIHRDIKGANIMVNEKGEAKIMDFGLAKVAGEALITKEARTMGTVAYMSPEQARGEEADQRTDIWSLGVALYEMLTGDLPFKGERETAILYSIVHEEPKPLRNFKADIPIEIQKIIDRSLQKDRASRYSSATEMLKDLRRLQDSLKAAEAGVLNLRSLLRRLRRPLVFIPTALGLLIVALVAAWLFSRQAKIRWAKGTLLPEIEQLIMAEGAGRDNLIDAYKLVQKAEKSISGNPRLSELAIL